MHIERKRRRPGSSHAAEPWHLRIYTAGISWRSQTVLSRLTDLCERHLPGRYCIEVVDLLKSPELARADEIVAVPTVKRLRPQPTKGVIGDLSDPKRVFQGLGFPAAALRAV